MNVQEHLLVCLAEECAEITHVCCKSLRFSLKDVNPLDPTGPDNRQWLINELNDFAALIQMLEAHNIIPRDWWSGKAQSAKVEKVNKFMEYAEKAGALQVCPKP